LNDFLSLLFKQKNFISIKEKSYSTPFFEHQGSLRALIYSYVFSLNNLSIVEGEEEDNSYNYIETEFKPVKLNIINSSFCSFANKFFSNNLVTKSSIVLKLRFNLEKANFKNFNDV
jgi:hypothetical protein